MTIDTILNALTEAVNGTDRKYFTQDELLQFATMMMEDYADEDEINDVDILVDEFIDYAEDIKPCRRCSICGRLMGQGYCYEDGEAYYCSDECLHEDFLDEEWEDICDGDSSYWTEW